MYGSMLPLLTEFMKPDVIAKMASGAGISDHMIGIVLVTLRPQQTAITKLR